MITIATLHQLVRGLNDWELQDWIARRWVRPQEAAEGYLFEDIDIARIRLIHQLRHELALDPGALPVILNLLDQLHAAHRQLAEMRQV